MSVNEHLEDQTKLFALLKPEENVGVRLTSGFLLQSERSTSAIVVHHPGAKCFVVYTEQGLSWRITRSYLINRFW